MNALLAVFLTISTSARAAELAGISMPDAATVGGSPVVLNGMGLREKYYVDVYVGALYLPAKTKDGGKAVADDVPKRIRMRFVYSKVEAAKMVETYQEGFAPNPAAKGLQPQITQFLGWMEDMVAGDEMALDYVPGQGTTLSVKGKVKGTIPGSDFMKLVFANYVGPSANKQLRTGLLGG